MMTSSSEGTKIRNDLGVESISQITSFLNVKEKAVVRSFNKEWLEGASLDHKVSLDPEVIGTNLDGAIQFIASSFPNLRHFSLSIDQGYFLNINGELLDDDGEEQPLQFHGHSLRDLFQNKTGLRSVSLWFGECVEEHTSRVLFGEQGLSTLHQQTSLQSLALTNPYFESITALSDMLRPLVNLEHLRLDNPSFPQSEFVSRNPRSNWRDSSGFIDTIAALPKLRRLIIHNNGFRDNEILGLAPILPNLTELELEGPFGDSFGQEKISLTDASMAFIAENSPMLQAFSVCDNERITIEGLSEILRKCPLRELQASDTGLNSEHLKDVVEACPTLRLIRYGSFRVQDSDKALREASIASGGRVLFVGPYGLYEPKFDSELMANHEKTKEYIEDLEKDEVYDD